MVKNEEYADLMMKDVSEEAMNTLMHYSYPGNVRELENIVEHAISFANSPQILSADLPQHMQQTPSQKVAADTEIAGNTSECGKGTDMGCPSKGGRKYYQGCTVARYPSPAAPAEIKGTSIKPQLIVSMQ